jgi:hypothetical protein
MPTPSVSGCQPGGSCSRPHVVREGHARGGRSAEENHHQKTKKPEAYGHADDDDGIHVATVL